STATFTSTTCASPTMARSLLDLDDAAADAAETELRYVRRRARTPAHRAGPPAVARRGTPRSSRGSARRSNTCCSDYSRMRARSSRVKRIWILVALAACEPAVAPPVVTTGSSGPGSAKLPAPTVDAAVATVTEDAPEENWQPHDPPNCPPGSREDIDA